jgi:hypothetical protein
VRRTLRWAWPVLLLAALVLVPRAIYAFRERTPLDVVVLDKTVPFRLWLEHRSLFWAMRALGVVRPDGAPYAWETDYLGAHPPETPGDPPERTRDLAPADLARADLLYIADTYGVYRDDLKSGEKMLAALERSPKVYGGLEPDEARAAEAYVRRGGWLVSEFNSLGSPTGDAPRETLERVLGVRWTHWIGRFFPELDSVDEVPQWMRRNYEREWKRPWTFTGPGYVLCYEDAHVEVLRVGPEVSARGLRLDRVASSDSTLAGAADGILYPYWFDVVERATDAELLATFTWRPTDAGRERLKARGLPETFPAVTVKRHDGGGRAFYFAGDFADNPLETAEVPFAGYLTFRRWIEAVKVAPSENAFYWRFYVPLVDRLVRDAAARRRGEGP